MTPIKNSRSESGERSVDEAMAALIKGMLQRGDRQSDIAACFMINGGRVSEINTRERFASVMIASEELLPPAGPYPSPYELFHVKDELRRAMASLQMALEATGKIMSGGKNE
jgi:hypothetical protein